MNGRLLRPVWLQIVAGIILGFVGSTTSQSEITRAPPSTEARLWKIESTVNDLQSTSPASWLYGTLHVENPQVLLLFDTAVPMFDKTDRLILEVNLAQLKRQDYEKFLLLPSDQSLIDLIRPDLFNATLEALASSGMTREKLNRYRPWAPILQLSVPKSTTGLFLDEKIRRLAIVRGKTIIGLESLAEQMNILGGLNQSDQIALLRYAIDSRKHFDKDFGKIIDLYIEGDLDELLATTKEQMDIPDRELAARIEQRLLANRNLIMVERLIPRLGEMSNFVAIGAAHLPGDDGVISLLRQNGYRVTATPERSP